MALPLILLLIAVLLAVLAGWLFTRGPSTPAEPTGPWRLVWSDEFNGSSLNPSNWVAENSSTYGDGGGAVSCQFDRPENLSVGDGVLKLTAQREASPVRCGANDSRFPAGRSYTSAHISTKGLHEWKYGRFELRAKLPTQAGTSKGMWPAFWLRPTAGGTGEIDVVEAVGSAAGTQESNQVHETLWYDYVHTHPKQARAYTFPSGEPSDGMHTYATDWSPTRISWYVDGRLVFQCTSKTTSWLKSTFDKPFYLRLNLAVGGDWPGDPTAATQFPSSLVVDYVRVYQR